MNKKDIFMSGENVWWLRDEVIGKKAIIVSDYGGNDVVLYLESEDSSKRRCVSREEVIKRRK